MITYTYSHNVVVQRTLCSYCGMFILLIVIQHEPKHVISCHIMFCAVILSYFVAEPECIILLNLTAMYRFDAFVSLHSGIRQIYVPFAGLYTCRLISHFKTGLI